MKKFYQIHLLGIRELRSSGKVTIMIRVDSKDADSGSADYAKNVMPILETAESSLLKMDSLT